MKKFNVKKIVVNYLLKLKIDIHNKAYNLMSEMHHDSIDSPLNPMNSWKFNQFLEYYKQYQLLSDVILLLDNVRK